jgi:hypothetical protein
MLRQTKLILILLIPGLMTVSLAAPGRPHAADAVSTIASALSNRTWVVERGENFRKLRTIAVVTNRPGPNLLATIVTNSYTELGAGICYQQEDGTWVDSRAVVKLSRGGGAEANETPHKVRFAPDLRSIGAVRITLPDGPVLSSTLRGLFFYEPRTERSILISEITNSIGTVCLPNRIVYSNCFATIKADLVLTVTKSGLEQDIVLREQLSFTPEDAGLDPDGTVLECWTEVFEAPVPQRRTRVLPPLTGTANAPVLTDETLYLGGMAMREGRAFSLSEDPRSNTRQTKSSQNRIPVGKALHRLEGDRKFLIEAARWKDVQRHIQRLAPRSAALASTNDLRSLVSHRLAPKPLVAGQTVAAMGQMQVAAIGTMNRTTEPGFVLDYVLVNGNWPSYHFRDGETYHIVGPVFIDGETRIDGGVVIKYDTWDTGAAIFANGTVVCDTSPMRPAILTARDDGTVGEWVAGSTGYPYQGNYAIPALAINNGAAELRHLRISYAARAIEFNAPGVNNVLAHCQITDCWGAIYNVNNTLSARNILVNNVDQVFDGGSFTVTAEHMTARLAFDLAVPWWGSGLVNLVNCLVVAIPYSSADYTMTTSEWLFDDAPIFHTEASGSFYLPSTSPYKGMGTASITPALKAELKSNTTCPPTLMAYAISQPTVLGRNPAVIRNGGTALDIGYCYYAMDYWTAGTYIDNSLLLATNGVVIGLQGSIWIGDTGRFMSEGSPTQMNVLVHTRGIQERSLSSWHLAFNEDYDICPPSELVLRFTHLVGHTPTDYLFNGGLCLGTLAMSDCQMRGGAISTWFEGPNERRIGMTNNIFEHVRISIDTSVPLFVHIYNNLFRNGSLNFYNGNFGWRVHDNLFDTVALSVNSHPVASSHNGYHQTTPLPSSSGNTDILLPNPIDYRVGPLGRFYLPSGSTPLLNGGSRVAATAGLFHHTTQVNQTKEGAKTAGTKVDVGFHYIALTVDNQPVDTDADLLPDYLEDTNGNGEPDLGELSYLHRDTDGDGLTDYEEPTITMTDPRIADTGDGGVEDGYKDSDGDGWTNSEEIRNGTNPFSFNTPKAPIGLSAVRNGSGSVTVMWEASYGNVTGYSVQRDTGAGFVTIATRSPTELSYTDPAPPANAQYQVLANYALGSSVATEVILPNNATRIFAGVTAVRRAGGQVVLVSSAIPEHVTQLRLYRTVLPSIYSGTDYRPIGNGSMTIPVAQLRNQIYTVPASFLPDFGRYNLHYNWETASDVGPIGFAGTVKPMPFIDGLSVMRDNLIFNLRAQRGGQPPYRFVCADDPMNPGGYVCHDDYFDSGLYYAPDLRELNPFHENYFMRNWAYNTADLEYFPSEDRTYFWTGVPEDGLYHGGALKYVFPAYNYVTTGNASLLNSQIPSASTPFIYVQYTTPAFWDPNMANVGLTRTTDDLGTQFASVHRNLPGLQYEAIRIFKTDDESVVDLLPGNTVTDINRSVGREYFQKTTLPIFLHDSYFFGAWWHLLPGDEGFNRNLTTRLLLQPVGESVQVYGYARKSIGNGFEFTKSAYLGNHFEKSYWVHPTTGARTESGILSEYGDFLPTQPGQHVLVTRPDPQDFNRQGEYTVNAIKLAVDMNHDRLMDLTFSGPDNTSSAVPYTFWLNNDNDGQLTDPPLKAEHDLPNEPDHGDWYIRSRRDMEDFARLWICGLPALPQSGGYSVALRWANSLNAPTIRIHRSGESDGGTRYLTDVATADGIVTTSSGAIATIGGSDVFTFPANFFDGADKYFMFEGAQAGKGELLLLVSQGEALIAATSVHIQIMDVKQMYDRATVINVSRVVPNSQQSTVQIDSMVAQDPTQPKQTLVFVHGWRVPYWSYLSFSETMFKRLYWQGYQGRFAALRWPALSVETDGLVGQFLSFNSSEYVAFKSGKGASQYFNKLRTRLPDHTISVAAHSQGNIVMAEAMRVQQAGNFQALNNYVLMQAAIPAHCFDGTLPDFADFVIPSNPTPDTYRNYASTANTALRPGGRIFNFFNPLDYAVVTGTIINKFGIAVRVSWEQNQIDYKPDSGFFYHSDAANGYRLNVPVTDPHELMAFCARPRSKGAGGRGGIGGAIQGPEVNLQTTLGLTGESYDHSGEFHRNIQNVFLFYELLLDRINP